MNEFLIAIHRDLTSDQPIPSPEQMKAALQPYQEWVSGIAGREQLIAPPQRWDIDGRIISKDEGVIRGPYAAQNKSLGGLLLIKARDYEEAVAIARECPIIPYGAVVEVKMAIPTA